MSELTPLQQTVNLLQKSDNILLLTHAKMDGDGLSSILALNLALNKLGKKNSTVSSDPPAPVYRFLPEIDSIGTNIAGVGDLMIAFDLGRRKNPVVDSRIEDGCLKIFIRAEGGSFKPEEINFGKEDFHYDLIVVCDTPDLPQLGRLFEDNPTIFYETPVINIDHHASNTGFGRVNLVDVTSASTTEIITRVIQALESETDQKLFDPDIATLLLTGIITDTGSFQNANTTPRSFEIAANLIALGARQQEIIHHIYKTKQLSTLKLWGRVLSNIQSDPLHRIVWSTITDKDLIECGAEESEATGIIDELMTNAPGAEIILLLKQNSGVSGSLRTTTPAIPATEIASLFGGGGHLQAAGFKIRDKKIEEVITEILDKIRAYQAERLNIHTGHEQVPESDTAEAKSKLASPFVEKSAKAGTKPKKKSLAEKIKEATKKVGRKK